MWAAWAIYYFLHARIRTKRGGAMNKLKPSSFSVSRFRDPEKFPGGLVELFDARDFGDAFAEVAFDAHVQGHAA